MHWLIVVAFNDALQAVLVMLQVITALSKFESVVSNLRTDTLFYSYDLTTKSRRP